MKKLSVLLIAAAVIFSGCKKDKESAPVVANLEVSTATVSLTAFAQSYEFTATSNVQFQVVSDAPAWATVATTTQPSGSRTVVVSIAKHDIAWTDDTTPARIAKLTLTAGDIVKTLTITQDGANVTARFTDPQFISQLRRDGFLMVDDRVLLSEATASSVKTLNILDTGVPVTSLAGIEYMLSVESLSLNGTNIKTLDLSAQTKIKTLTIHSCPLLESVVMPTTSPDLTSVELIENAKLSTIDLTKSANLASIKSEYVPLTTLDITKNTKLTQIYIRNSKLKTLDASKCPNVLGYLTVTDSELTSINTTGCALINGLALTGNKLTSLDLSTNVALTSVQLNNNLLTTLDLSKNVLLTRLRINGNKFTALNFSAPLVNYLECSNNEFVNLDLGTLPALGQVICTDNKKLQSIDMSQNPQLSLLQCYRNAGLANVLSVKVPAALDIAALPSGLTAANPAQITVPKVDMTGNETITSNVKYVQ